MEVTATSSVTSKYTIVHSNIIIILIGQRKDLLAVLDDTQLQNATTCKKDLGSSTIKVPSLEYRPRLYLPTMWAHRLLATFIQV